MIEIKIKMEMPKNCSECTFSKNVIKFDTGREFEKCAIGNFEVDDLDVFNYFEKRHQNCPLKEVK